MNPTDESIGGVYLENTADFVYFDCGGIRRAGDSARRAGFLGNGGNLRSGRISVFRTHAALQAKAGGGRKAGETRRPDRPRFRKRGKKGRKKG